MQESLNRDIERGYEMKNSKMVKRITAFAAAGAAAFAMMSSVCALSTDESSDNDMRTVICTECRGLLPTHLMVR